MTRTVMRRWLRTRRERKVARTCGCAHHTNARRGSRGPFVTNANPGRGVPNYCDTPRVWEPWEVPSPGLDDARRLLADADRAERRERCAARGHAELLHEITRFDSAQAEHLCTSCGATIREDR